MRKDRALISRLHVLNKEIVNLKKQKDVPRSVQSTRLEVLQQEVEKVGCEAAKTNENIAKT